MSKRHRWKPRRPQPARPTLVDPFGPGVVPRDINESFAAVAHAIQALAAVAPIPQQRERA